MTEPPSREADFILAFEPHQKGGYRTLVLEAPAGTRSQSRFVPPFDPIQTEGLMRRFGEQVRATTGVSDVVNREAQRGASPGFDPSAVGVALHQALFRDRVRDAFIASKAKASASGGRLRLRLVFGIGDGPPDEIAGLPWELLSPKPGEFLVLGEKFSVIRELDVGTDKSWQPLGSGFRVLAAMAEPVGHSPLRLKRELERLRDALTGWPQVEVVPFRGATISHLRERLEEGGFEVLHFMGHGGFDNDQGEGHLIFEREGCGNIVTGSLLAQNLRDLPKLRLTLLNACHSGATPRSSGKDPYLGVASALLSGGQAAVVAMQAAIPNEAAIEFSVGFYRALARGLSVESALFQGRLKVLNEYSDSSAVWAVPALFAAPSARTSQSFCGLGSVTEGTPAQSLSQRWNDSRFRLIVGFSLFLPLLYLWLHSQVESRWSGSKDSEVGAVGSSPGPELQDSLNGEVAQQRSEGSFPPLEVSESPTDLVELPDDAKTGVELNSEPSPIAAPVQPAPLPMSALTANKISVLVFDPQTGRLETSLATILATVLETEVRGLRTTTPTTDLEHFNGLLGDEASMIPTDGTVPWGAEHLLLATARVNRLSPSNPTLEGLSLTLSGRLIAATDRRRSIRFQETHSGLAMSREGALLQASERCLADVIENLRKGEGSKT